MATKEQIQLIINKYPKSMDWEMKAKLHAELDKLYKEDLITFIIEGEK